ncbi:hypothetical protein DL238_15370 [Alteriqipengyuania lutimaris]|uniref:DUF2169 domain-containing protein n=2 Tax=Alteriqipengyuania lutimaris TaxID=1538146 RepID=A0A395LHD1_9SPHN|nr:hypothetical protein DL238_15370 [Alteriqipengyuania lutimaris]
MDHPADVAGRFPCPDLDRIKIDRETARIVRCTAMRDSSGFHRTEEIGTVLFTPFASEIWRALRFGAEKPVERALLQQTGALTSSTSPADRSVQPLSDWQLRIEEANGDVTVLLSAALHAVPRRDWLASEGNFWEQQAGARVETRFTISAATRVACFGAHIPHEHAEAEGATSQPTSPDGRRLNLAQAPVGPQCEFGIRDRHWVDFGSHSGGSQPNMTITEHRNVRRLTNGFLSHGLCVWPRIWIRGLSLASISSALGAESLRLSGGGIVVSLSDDGREGWSQTASESALEFRLQADGLALDYDLTVAGRVVKDRVLLPWELLILRYPSIGVRRQEILDSA